MGIVVPDQILFPMSLKLCKGGRVKRLQYVACVGRDCKDVHIVGFHNLVKRQIIKVTAVAVHN